MQLRIQNKIVGNLVDDTLVKKGRQVVKMDVMDGFGLPQAVVLDPRIEKVRLHHSGKIYKTGIGQFITHGIPYHHPPYEPQLILPVRYFHITDERQSGLEFGDG